MPRSQPKLKLPTSTRVAIFRAMDDHFRADPVLRSVVKTWHSWTGSADEHNKFSLAACPWVRLSTAPGPQVFWAQSTKKGALFINVELIVSGYCSDDLDNLWAAFERSCYRAHSSEQLAFQLKLRGLGAHSGHIEFSQVAFDPSPAEGCLSGIGQLAIEYRFDLHPASPGL